MSDHTARGNDRRQGGRRDVDRDTHILEQGVIAAAMRWRRAQGGELDLVDTRERIDAARNLANAVDNLEQYGGMDETGASTIDTLGVLVVGGLIVVPSTVLERGTWEAWLWVVVGLVILGWLMWRGERA